MFRDAHDLLFTHDGVPAALVRAGEPQMHRHAEPADGPVLAVSRSSRPAPLRRFLRLTTS